MYTPSKKEIQMLKQHTRHLYCKINLMDRDFNLIDNLEGVAISCDISIDSTADIRRTFSATIHLDNKTPVSKILSDKWASKFLRLFIGMDSPSNETLWYSKGVYAIAQNSFIYNVSEHTLSINGVDLVAMLDGTLGGELTGSTTKIPIGSDIGNAIVRTFELSEMSDCVVNYWKRTVPYDLEYGAGTTIWSILTELRDLYHPFEMYFDETTFVCKEMATGYDAPLAMSQQDFEDLIISENGTLDYNEIKNCVELWGASCDYNAYAEEGKVIVDTKGDTTTFNVTAANISSRIEKSPNFAFVSPKTAIGNTVKIKATVGELKYDEGILYQRNTDKDGKDVPMKGSDIPLDTIIVIKYDSEMKKYYFQGQQQIHVMVKLVDRIPTEDEKALDKKQEGCNDIKYICLTAPDASDWDYGSHFTIEQLGRRNKILSGNEYEVYDTTTAAMECAEYQHWTMCRLTDGVQLECLLVPWLDVNEKIAFVPRYINTGEQPIEFMIKSINISLGQGTMTLGLCRYWPYYPYIVQDKY